MNTKSESQIEKLNASLYELSQTVRVLDAPDDEMAKAIAAIDGIKRQLDAYKHGGTYAQAMLDAETMPMTLEGDYSTMMPYSPFVGPLHPASPRFHFAAENGFLDTELVFPATYAGPPASVHGGFIAPVFDEMLSAANLSKRLGAFTGSLTIHYRKTTPLLQPVRAIAEVMSVDGRKVKTRGEFRYRGEITAEAEGLFVMPSADYRW
jgi:acyl-coenzyme A thioesterase PaaI-like protein